MQKRTFEETTTQGPGDGQRKQWLAHLLLLRGFIKHSQMTPWKCRYVLSTRQTRKGQQDSKYRGTGSHFMNPIKHVPPISVNWPTEDEAGRISASDAYRILFSYRTPWPHFIHFKKDSQCFNLRVPDYFGRHVPNGKHQLKFHNKGKIWSIATCSNQKKKAHFLTSGWQEFIDENEIRSGDICICELVGECEVKVLMLKVRDPSPTYVNKNAPLNSIKHQSSGTAEPWEVDPDYPGTAFKRSIPHGPPDPIEDAFGRISSSDAIRIAWTYCTSWPNFIKVIKATNCGLYVPSQFGTHLPQKTHQLKLHNREKGKSWTIKVAYENKRNIHTFSGGWQKFIGDNELRYGDVCIFELLGKLEVSVLILKVRDPSQAYINELHSRLKE